MLDLTDYGHSARDLDDLERDCKAMLAIAGHAIAFLDALAAVRTNRADGLLDANRASIDNTFHDEIRCTLLILADVAKEAGLPIERDLRAKARRLDVDWNAQYDARMAAAEAVVFGANELQRVPAEIADAEHLQTAAE